MKKYHLTKNTRKMLHMKGMNLDNDESCESFLENKMSKQTQTSILSGIDKAHAHEHIKVAPVAWIIIISEALHNFIDGLSIGAAYSEMTLKGLSLSLAILCEELPHKLGL
jgi:zinc transporter ZupT